MVTVEVKGKEGERELGVKNLFSVLRRGEEREGAKAEVERREDEVEDRLEG